MVLEKTLENLLQHHGSKASIQFSAFFMVQLSHPYVTIGKTIALTIWNFGSKVMSLLFNTLFIIAFLPRSKRLGSNAREKSGTQPGPTEGEMGWGCEREGG